MKETSNTGKYKNSPLGVGGALQKLRQYCAYQERSHYEVLQKLWDLGVRKADHDEIITSLIEDDYLNEERFAIQFAGGKFRMKEWGRKKIWYALKEKKVSDYCIKKGLKSIDDESYEKTLNSLAEKKYVSLKGEQYLTRRKKTIDFLLQKGYEPELINKALNSLTEE
jgi:regulatory protein